MRQLRPRLVRQLRADMVAEYADLQDRIAALYQRHDEALANAANLNAVIQSLL